jgi:ABC-type nitrate/sulfonate/bicarbonate transport system substrate-binding protein
MSRLTAFAAALVLALIGLPRPGAAAEAVVLQLHGPAMFEFAGYYAALWKGFYQEAGLAVEIRPGGVSGGAAIDPARELAEGRAQFGTGTMQLIIRAAQGLPLLLVAPVFQESGAAVYYRTDTDFSSPAALVKARLGRLPASDILDIELATALRAEGIDPARIKSVSVEPGQVVAALADRTIDAAPGSAWMLPWQAHEHGTVFKSFNPANYRVEYYGDSLFTLKSFADAHPGMVSRFRAATLKGWEFALQHPEEITARLVSDPPSPPPVGDAAGFARYQVEVARRLARYPDIPLGYSNLDRWTQIEAGMLGAGALERSADLTGFVYNPDSETRGGGLRGTIVTVALVAVLAAVVAACAWLGLSLLRRRPKAEPTPAEPAAVLIEPPPIEASASAETPAAAPVESEAPPVKALPPILPSPPVEASPATAAPPPIETQRIRAPARRVRKAPKPIEAEPEPAPPPLPAPIDLNAVLAPLDRRIRQRVRGKVRFRFSLLPELWPCRAEGGALAAVVLDLVAAATVLMDADGSMIVGTRNIVFDEANIDDFPGARLGAFARITVRDNGPAIWEAQLERIFDPVTTARPSIAAAAAEIERIGGFVRVESAEGVGTAVHLYFARAETPAAARGLGSVAKPPAEVAE